MSRKPDSDRETQQLPVEPLNLTPADDPAINEHRRSHHAKVKRTNPENTGHVEAGRRGSIRFWVMAPGYSRLFTEGREGTDSEPPAMDGQDLPF